MKKNSILLILSLFLFSCVTTPEKTNSQEPGLYCPEINTTQVDFYDNEGKFLGSELEDAPKKMFDGVSCYKSISVYAVFVIFHGEEGRVKGNLCLWDGQTFQKALRVSGTSQWICP